MFWTGLWGVVGLVLATPVTVCLAVLGKHVRQLGFLAVLLGREAALRPAARYYQRLLARDRLEAEAVVKEYLADHPVEDLFDRVLVPALVLVRRGRKAGELRPEDEEFILRTTREIVDGLARPPRGGGLGTGRPGGGARRAGGRRGGRGGLGHAPPPVAAGRDGRLVAAGLPASGVADSSRGRPGRRPDRRGRAGRADRGPVPLPPAAGPVPRGEDRRRPVGPGGRPRKARALLLSAGADRVAGTLRERGPTWPGSSTLSFSPRTWPRSV